jgi:hypothetical protein
MMTRTSQVGQPVRHRDGWFVPSGAVGYYVERIEERIEEGIDGRWRCTCPSMRWGRHKLPGGCKHIRQVIRCLEGACE